MTAEEGRGRRGHNEQVISNGGRGNPRGARQGDREAKSEGWSVGSDEASDEETEDEGMPAGEQEGSEVMQKASPWGMQESGEVGIRVDARAGGNDGRKAPSATANKAETQGRHGP